MAIKDTADVRGRGPRTTQSVMEPPDSVPHPDAFFGELTASEHGRLRSETIAAARASLPCSHCGSTAEPVMRKPERFSAEWWDEPATYLACADCGLYLEPLSVWLHYPAWFMADMRAGPD